MLPSRGIINNMKSTRPKQKCPTKVPNINYIPLVHIGPRDGCNGVPLGGLGFALGPQGFLNSNMLVSATGKSHIGGIAPREPPTRVVLRCSGIWLYTFTHKKQ